ncbi:MAG: hypothetical protein LUH53_02035 [Lachnospiraceae bacterium]|nr:hypothetical protein [Lachnospiraceae bacterium]
MNMKQNSVSFPNYIFRPWLTYKIGISTTAVTVGQPNVVLGLFPAGKQEETLPLRNISDVESDISYDFKGMFTGIGLFLLATLVKFLLGGLLPNIISFVLVVAAVRLFLRAFRAELNIYHSDNTVTCIGAPPTARIRMGKARNAILEALDYEADKTDLNTHTDSMANAFADAMSDRLSPDLLREEETDELIDFDEPDEASDEEWDEEEIIRSEEEYRPEAFEFHIQTSPWDYVFFYLPYILILVLYLGAGAIAFSITAAMRNHLINEGML